MMRTVKIFKYIVLSATLWANVVVANEIPDLMIDDFQKGKRLISVGYSSLALKGELTGKNDSGSVLALDAKGKFSRFDLSYYYAVSDALSIDIQIPYQVLGTSNFEGKIGNTQSTINSEEETGLDDISFGVTYRFFENNVREAIKFVIDLDNADDSEGQSEIKVNGITVQELKKSGQGRGYEIYSLNYYLGIVHNSKLGIELSPYFTHRENTEDDEPGDSRGINLSGRYQINNNLKALFALGYDIHDDDKFGSTEYEGYNVFTFGGGISLAITEQKQISLTYLSADFSKYKSKNSDLTIKESANILSISWQGIF